MTARGIRIALLLAVLAMVGLDAWLTRMLGLGAIYDFQRTA